MAGVDKLKRMRTTTHEMRREYLERLMAHPDFNEPGLKSALPDFLSSERKERRVDGVDELIAKTGANKDWKATLHVLAWSADGTREH